MRLTTAIGEASRNMGRAVTQWWFVVPAFVLLVGASTFLSVTTADTTLSRAERNAAQGVNGLEIQGPIGGAACESVARTERFTASGAQLILEPVTLRVEPGSPVSAVRITPGAASFYGIDSPDAPGIHVSQGLWEELGMPETLALGDGTDVAIAGAFSAPSHVSDLRRLLVEVVPATGRFDTCLVDRLLALPGDGEALMRTVDAPNIDGVTLTQLNSEFGPPFDGRQELEAQSRFSTPFWAAIGGGAIAALGAIRLRRRELALQRQMGASKSTVALIHGVEAAIWAGIGAVIVFAVLVVWAARSRTAPQAQYLLEVGVRETLIGLVTAVVVSAAGAACVRRKSVLRYLRDTA